MITKILVATHNKGKVAELADMLRDLHLSWLSLKDAGIKMQVAEKGTTFEENAIAKAVYYAAEAGLLTLADDSGLEVDALGGRPGVNTARFGGAKLTPRQRYELLLRKLENIPWAKRTARFHCAVALSRPDGLIGTASGVCEGLIALEPSGEGGFGYDPVFFLPHKGVTMAQLETHEKHRISHRGRAFAAIAPLLRTAVQNLS